jgi:(1->4)-alpha-D-glucan 1-alpha-D-glucosylmutase
LKDAAASIKAALEEEISARRHIPHATYRLQLNSAFRFRDAQALVPYLTELGISDLYISPILQACAGSQHGYDICEYNEINAELGGSKDLASLGKELSKNKMGIVLDIVPNHMGISDARNTWWMDVLENGSSSPYAPYFDIDWNPVKSELAGKVLLPILEDQYGKVLEEGKIRLIFESGSFFIVYGSNKLPVAPRTYSSILSYRLDALSKSLGPNNPHLQELQSILTALSYLPTRAEQDAEKIAERNREKEVIKRRITALCEASAEICEAIEGTVKEFNGIVNQPQSFDHLDELISMQVYRPAFWKVAAEEINYRRFFDINHLAAIRMEDPQVFEAAHELVFDLLLNGPVTGLRIDHADGLWDPAAYLRQIQYCYLQKVFQSRWPSDGLPAETGTTLSALLAARFQTRAHPFVSWPVYVVVEKILCAGEPLPKGWTIYGTTGYDFLNAANGLFVDGSKRDPFTRVYAGFIGGQIRYETLVNSAKKMMMLVSLASEVYALSHQLDRISERNRRYRDFTLDSLTFAIREVIASLEVYRTYITGPNSVSQKDSRYIEAAVDAAKKRNPRTSETLFDFVRDTLLLRNQNSFPEQERENLIQWVMKFQQITGPVMAKGCEDTAFYVYNRLLSLNEVGGNPASFGTTIASFHQHNEDHAHQWPYSMLASTTHDTKRSEDVRARINVLSELPEEWSERLKRWKKMNAPQKTIVDGERAPDPNDEYLFYQTLLGAWPVAAPHRQSEPSEQPDADFRERIAAYMHKAIKEAKMHTSWINPNREYDDAVRNFVLNVLHKDAPNAFLDDFLPFQKRIDFYGRYNALAQLLLKLTSPGIPDTYQGAELWDLRLVDPDNRGPVDYRIRISYLYDLRNRIRRLEKEQVKTPALKDLAMELLESSHDGRVKLYVLHRALNFRRLHPELFAIGKYTPLFAKGIKDVHVCSFSRRLANHRIVVAVPRLVVRLTNKMERPPFSVEIWRDTRLELPDDLPGQTYRNLFTGEILQVERDEGFTGLPLSAVFSCFPVALLELV